MKLFKFLLFFVTIAILTISCEPEALESNTYLEYQNTQANGNQKDIIDDKKNIDDIRDAVPNLIDSLMVN
jgi:hypothetical protein